MNLITVKVARLQAGPLLDYMTAIASGAVIPPPHTESVQKVWAVGLAHKPSTRQDHCFDLIEKFKLEIEPPKNRKTRWTVWSVNGFYAGADEDLKVAVCKSLIQDKIGREVTYDADIFEGPTND